MAGFFLFFLDIHFTQLVQMPGITSVGGWGLTWRQHKGQLFPCHEAAAALSAPSVAGTTEPMRQECPPPGEADFGLLFGG
jgi:hypothetical protein